MATEKERREYDRFVKEAVEVLGDPAKNDIPISPAAYGVGRRPYVTVAKSFGPGLTKRQKTASGARYRIRCSREVGRMFQLLEDTGMSMDEFVGTLSNEELVRGQIRDKNGEFRGAPPMMVPRAFHRACVAELMKRGKTLWREHYLEAIEVFGEIMRDKVYATPGERLRAAQEIVFRLEGKIPEKLIVDSGQPWQVAIDGIVAEVSDEAVQRGQKLLNGAQAVRQEIIIEGEVDAGPPSPPPRSTGRGKRYRRGNNGA